MRRFGIPQVSCFLLIGLALNGFYASASTPISRLAVTDTIEVGYVSNLALSNDGATLFAVKQGDTGGTDNRGTVIIIDTSTKAKVGEIRLDVGFAFRIASTQEGGNAYVAVSKYAGSTNTTGKDHIAVINTSSNTVVDRIILSSTNTCGPIGVVLTPDDSHLYTSCRFRDSVDVIDTASNTRVKSISVGDGPVGLSMTPDGTRLYVANRSSRNLSVINTATNTKITDIPLTIDPSGSATSINLTPDGKRAYITYNYDGPDRIAVVDTDPSSPYYNKEVATVSTTGEFLEGIAVASDGAFALVSSYYTHEVLIIDTDPESVDFHTQIGRVTGALAGPSGIVRQDLPLAVAYVADNGVSVIGIENGPPTAVAGDDQDVRPGDTVYLDGSASFDDNTASEDLGYAWTFASVPEGCSPLPIVGDDTATPSFIADCEGTYTVELVVTDGDGAVSLPDEVEASSENLAPTADPGMDKLVIVGNTVILDGSGSSDPDPEDYPLKFSWTITSAPEGSTATLNGPDTVSPSFVPDVVGPYDISLEVSDWIGPGELESITITATTAEDYAVRQIISVGEIATDLDPDLNEVTTEGNQTAFGNYLRQATVAIQEGDLEEAIDKLQKAIERSDGCVLGVEADGNGPGRDWITSCDAQTEIYDKLNLALATITP